MEKFHLIRALSIFLTFHFIQQSFDFLSLGETKIESKTDESMKNERLHLPVFFSFYNTFNI